MWPIDTLSENKDKELKNYARSLDLDKIIASETKQHIDAVKITQLAREITKIAKNDLERIKLIYIWIAENIAYDDDSFNNKTITVDKATPSNVLKTKLAVCEGFSNLVTALGKSIGLEVVKVSGYCKGFGYTEGTIFNEANHAWNVFISGNYCVLRDLPSTAELRDFIHDHCQRRNRQ